MYVPNYKNIFFYDFHPHHNYINRLRNVLNLPWNGNRVSRLIILTRGNCALTFKYRIICSLFLCSLMVPQTPVCAPVWNQIYHKILNSIAASALKQLLDYRF
jgi:hypothetical protein